MTQQRRSRRLWRALAAGLALSLLAAGCSRGVDDTPLQLEVSRVIAGELRAERNLPSAPEITPALKAQIQVPQLEIFMEKTAQRNYLTPEYRGGDQTPGVVEVWRTVDGVSMGFRDGMLMSTRGLRWTLLSAKLPADGRGAAGPARGGARSYQLRAGDEGAVQVALACDLQDQGLQGLHIVDQTHQVRHLRETCEGDAGALRVANDYWVEQGSGRLLQSRQWAGPEIGYLRFRLVHLGRGGNRVQTLMQGH